MKKSVIISLFLVATFGCRQSIEVDKDKQSQIQMFAKHLFTKVVINSRETLDSIKVLTDESMADTTTYVRTPKATLFKSNSNQTHFKVFEKPKGTITAIAFYLNGNKIYVAEYFANGHVICNFKVNDDGKRNGPYTCYHEDGAIRILGYYQNDKEVKDSAKYFDK